MNVKTASDIKSMEKVCQLAAQTLQHASKFIKAGITTNELDKIVYDYTLSHDAKPAPLTSNDFPKSICTSVNHCICHGVPDDIPLKDGDIINVDVTCYKYGFHGDTSATFFVGNVSEAAKKITHVAEGAMYKGIEAVRAGAHLGDIGYAIQKHAEGNRFSVNLIPETLTRTLFGQRKVGDLVNLEVDPQTQAIVDTVERVLANRL